VGEDVRQEYVQRSARWLILHQNEDGGWGETCASYADPGLAGQGPSTASQTAWALLSLLAVGQGTSKAVRRGVVYLAETQRQDGSWDEPYFAVGLKAVSPRLVDWALRQFHSKGRRGKR